MLTQGKPGVRRRLCVSAAAAWTWAGPWAASAAESLGDEPLRLNDVTRWWPGLPGDADADNRGRVSGLLAVHHQERWWSLGSGPSRRVAALWLQVLTGTGPQSGVELLSPWARPELVLGAKGLRARRHWALAEVQGRMRAQCTQCEARLRQRLGAAQGDLGPGPAAELPPMVLRGSQGVWGPWRWWRLWRGPDVAVTVCRLRDRAWWSVPGLLWTDGPPDLRDADLNSLQASLAWLAALTEVDGGTAVFFPEQGERTGVEHLVSTRDYLRQLRRAIQTRQAQGGLESEPAGVWPGLDPALARHARHALNWQRAWRQIADLN